MIFIHCLLLVGQNRCSDFHSLFTSSRGQNGCSDFILVGQSFSILWDRMDTMAFIHCVLFVGRTRCSPFHAVFSACRTEQMQWLSFCVFFFWDRIDEMIFIECFLLVGQNRFSFSVYFLWDRIDAMLFIQFLLLAGQDKCNDFKTLLHCGHYLSPACWDVWPWPHTKVTRSLQSNMNNWM